MRITMIGTLPPIKGVSDYCIEQVETLCKKIKIDFINFKSIYPKFLYPQDPEEKDQVFQYQQHANLNVSDVLKWYNPVGNLITGSRIKTSIIHFHWWTSFLFVVFYPVLLGAKLFHRVQIICTLHNVVGHESGFFDRLITRIMLTLPDHFIVHTEATKNKLKALNKTKDENISIIPHGRYDFYKHSSLSASEAKKILNLPQSGKVILFFGFIREYKGIDTLIAAMKRIHQEVPDAILYIAGNCWISWDVYQQMIVDANLEKQVFTDIRYIPSSEIQNYFAAADVVVLPYKEFDSQSGPGNIAIGFQKPLIVSHVGGLPDLVKTPDAIFEPGDEKALADTLIRLFNNPDLMHQLHLDSKSIADTLSWDAIADRTIQLYQSIVPEDKNEFVHDK